MVAFYTWTSFEFFVFIRYHLLGDILAPKECIICHKNKTTASSSVYEPVIKCATYSSAEMLLAFAEMSDDLYIRAQLIGASVPQITAKEFHFHRSCYRVILRPVKDKSNTEYLRDECFNDLKLYVQLHIIENGEFRTINQLSTFYSSLQTRKNLPVKGAAHNDVKISLISEFGDNLVFYQKSKIQSEYVYYKTIPVEEDERSCFFYE